MITDRLRFAAPWCLKLTIAAPSCRFSFMYLKNDEGFYCSHRIWSVMFLWRMTTARSGFSLFMTLTTVAELQKRFVCVFILTHRASDLYRQ